MEGLEFLTYEQWTKRRKKGKRKNQKGNRKEDSKRNSNRGVPFSHTQKRISTKKNTKQRPKSAFRGSRFNLTYRGTKRGIENRSGIRKKRSKTPNYSKTNIPFSYTFARQRKSITHGNSIPTTEVNTSLPERKKSKRITHIRRKSSSPFLEKIKKLEERRQERRRAMEQIRKQQELEARKKKMELKIDPNLESLKIFEKNLQEALARRNPKIENNMQRSR